MGLKKLKKLKEAESAAIKELKRELERQFPEGTRVGFRIMHGQKNLSTGEVVGYRENGYLSVWHDQAKKNSRYRVRDVFFKNIETI